MGILFILLMLSFQMIGPLVGHFQRKSSRPDVQRYVDILAPVQRILPPGLAADAIAQAIYPRVMMSFSSFALLCAFALVVGYCLHVRLLSQYRGENLSEVAASAMPSDRSLRLGWRLPGFSAPGSAGFEKEIRYLLPNGPMPLTAILPTFAVVLLRFP